MLISTSHRFVYVHINKCGGTSIRRQLEHYCLKPSTSRINKLLGDSGLQKDYTKRFFRDHDPISKLQPLMSSEEFDSYYKFSIVRNPWDWLVSMYAFIVGFAEHHNHQRISAMSFAEYVDYEIAKNKRRPITLVADANHHLLVDRLGRFESLAEDFADICQTIGLQEMTLPHANRSEHRDYIEYYDPRTRQRVAEHWAPEIEVFGYSFDA
ncbi:sulfotransferase family 2 domain-containing protein [Gammaproteobacteria bacterium]|nr:sulfotransferase family 2 domain-containing protein [Gammaproteobacteria bacterium]